MAEQRRLAVHKSICASVLAWVLAALASPSWAGRDGVDYVADRDVMVYGGSHYWNRSQNPVDAQTLYAERFGTQTRSTLYRGEGVLSDIKASPKGSLVGVLERIWQENVSPDRATYVDRRVGERGELQEFYYFEESTLNILNLDGVIQDTIKGVRRFAWDPSGTSIAYITGDHHEGGVGFATTGTWMYDLASKQARRIHPGGIAVEWATWDGKVYIYDPFNEAMPETRVFRFDPVGEQLVPTAHKGIGFSADGRYYYAEEDAVELSVFQTDSDKQVTLDLPNPVYDAAGWLGQATLIVPSPVPGDRGDYLYDVQTGTKQHAGGAVLPAKRSAERALVLDGVSFIERRIAEFDVVR
jgi:hypothetical protein